jgi:HD-GYP domain-containing protein (c-di-GMP phosphodiesterase class II)
MFIHDLNCSWIKHPFFGSGRNIKIDSDQIVEKIINHGIPEVYIDTELGLDVGDAPTQEEIEREIQEKIVKAIEKVPETGSLVSVEEEILNARKIKQETVHTVQRIMDDVTSGGQIKSEKVKHLVDDIVNSVFRNQDALIGLGRLRKINDYLYNHSMSVCVLMTTFCRNLGFDTRAIKEIGIGAMLHDIGISKIPTSILNKKSALTDEEYEKIKEHVQHGRTLLEQTEGITETSLTAAYQHHERLDGSGYPNALKGDEITQYGQAMAIVDVYDALTTKRCNKRKIQPTEALKMLYEWDGQFNSDLVQKFIRCIGIYPVGSLVLLESGLLAVVVNHGEENALKPIVRAAYDTKTESTIVTPYDIDLAKPSGKGGGDRIESYASPEQWDIQPDRYL